MKISAVIGAGFGDEGKGHTVSYLVSKSEHPLVVRYNGGQQAGHTVVYNGIRHVFSSFGSGTLQGASTYISKHCTVYPKTLVTEYKALKKLGINPSIDIDGRVAITTPYDVLSNRLSGNGGTCGLGIGTTIQREEDYYHLTFNDLSNKFVLKTKMSLIKEYYKRKFKGYTPSTDDDNLEKLELSFYESVEYMNDNHIGCVKESDRDYDHIIFEGAQGLLLDQNIGFFPYVTRSNTGFTNILEILNEQSFKFEICNTPNIYYITRSYQTRHGKGPMSDERELKLINNENETNVSNFYQGDFRRGLLDVNLIDYAIKKDMNSYIYDDIYPKINLVVTCLDQVPDQTQIILNNKIVNICSSDINKYLNTSFAEVYHSYGAETKNIDYKSKI